MQCGDLRFNVGTADGEDEEGVGSTWLMLALRSPAVEFLMGPASSNIHWGMSVVVFSLLS